MNLLSGLILLFCSSLVLDARENYKAEPADGEEPVTELTDSRDGKVYKVVKLGKHYWMAENLSFKMPGSWCFNNDADNCEKYGRLYTWDDGMKACPPGWHLPSEKEWSRMITSLGNGHQAYENLVVDGQTGFNATLHGINVLQSMKFVAMGVMGCYWSATSSDETYAPAQRFVEHTKETYASPAYKINGQGCRCVMN